jgi:hypothetical protein
MSETKILVPGEGSFLCKLVIAQLNSCRLVLILGRAILHEQIKLVVLKEAEFVGILPDGFGFLQHGDADGDVESRRGILTTHQSLPGVEVLTWLAEYPSPAPLGSRSREQLIVRRLLVALSSIREATYPAGMTRNQCVLASVAQDKDY